MSGHGQPPPLIVVPPPKEPSIIDEDYDEDLDLDSEEDYTGDIDDNDDSPSTPISRVSVPEGTPSQHNEHNSLSNKII